MDQTRRKRFSQLRVRSTTHMGGEAEVVQGAAHLSEVVSSIQAQTLGILWAGSPRQMPATPGSPGPAGGHGPTGSCAERSLEVWPESHWPGFARRQAGVFQSYTA